MKPVAKACGCHQRSLARAVGELTDDVEARAAHLCGQWGCGVERATGRTPQHDALAAHVAQVQGLDVPPARCPFEALYRHTTPLVERASTGLARKGDRTRLDDDSAFPGGVTHVDVVATDIIRRAQNAREASDDAMREKQRRADELARKAAQP